MWSVSKFFVIALIGLTLLSSVYAVGFSGNIQTGHNKISKHPESRFILQPELKITPRNTLNYNEFLFNASGSKCYFENRSTKKKIRTECNFTKWVLDYGDGTNNSGTDNPNTTTHIYINEGNYKAELTVYAGNVSKSRARLIFIFNKPPIVNAGNDFSVKVNEIASFNGSAVDPDGIHSINNKIKDITKYEWDFNGDGVFDWSSNESAETNYIYTTPGNYTATLKATDRKGAVGLDSINVEVLPSDAPIILSFNSNASKGIVPLAVEFNGSAIDKENLSYTLVFDINNYSNNITGAINSTESTLGNYIYSNTGNHTAKLIVEDGFGGINSSEIVIEVINSTIINQPPIANFSYTNSTYYTFKFNDTSIDTDGNITTWFWNFADGTNSTEQNPTHEFAKKTATYNVTLTVTDNNGSKSNYSKEIKVIKPIEENNNNIIYTGGGWTPVHKNNTKETKEIIQTTNTSNEIIQENKSNSTTSTNKQPQKDLQKKTNASATQMTGLATGVLNDPIATPILTFLSITAIGLFLLGKLGLGKGAVSIRKLIKIKLKK